MKRLVITEKANAARRISTILSDEKQETTKVDGATVITFTRGGDEFSVIGLRGHIIELDYPEHYNNWSSVPPEELINAPQEKLVKAKNILSAIRTLSAEADQIIIATDYDREGELIGLETVRLAAVNMETVRRARFSALTKGEVENAFENLTIPDAKLADAAEARQIIDLTWGAVLTRMISIYSGQLGRNFLSVGRVQSPTLRLLIDRHQEIEDFVPEPFWLIKGSFAEEGFQGEHSENPFWDKAEAEKRMVGCGGVDKAKVLSFSVEERDDFPPSPFSTTILLTEANRIGIPPGLAMKLAEDLYTSGFISYPRTDNTVYPKSLSLKGVLNRLADSEFSKEVAEILDQETIRPSRGKRMTTDHPPIYPTGVASSKKIKGDKWKIYELVVRRFLATVAPSGRVEEKSCTLDVGGETFEAKGQKLLFEGWRRYYPHYRFTENLIPNLEEGSMVDVKDLAMEQDETRPPYRFNQGSIIQEMENLNLGTKSTRHDIVGKLYSRNYVQGKNLIPTPSGMALVKALQKYGGQITDVEMTARLEEDMGEIADGEKSLEFVVKESQQMLSAAVDVMKANRNEIGEEIRKALHEQSHIGKCAECGGNITIKRSRKGNFIGCDSYPDCNKAFPMPRSAMIQPTEEGCAECGMPVLRVIRRGQPPQEQCVDPDCITNKQMNDLGKCPKCGEGTVRMLFSRAGKRFAGCSSWPDCDQTYPLPLRGKIEVLSEQCGECGSPVIGLGERQQCINPECPTRPKKAAKKPKAATAKKKKTVKKTV